MISVVNGELFRQCLHSYVWWHIFKTVMEDKPTLLIIALIVVWKAFKLPAQSSHQWWQLIEYSTYWFSIYIRVYFFFFSLPLSCDSQKKIKPAGKFTIFHMCTLLWHQLWCKSGTTTYFEYASRPFYPPHFLTLN